MNFVEIVVNAAPMLLLIGVWIFFMSRMRNGGFNTKYQNAYLEQLKAQTAALERIAAAVEKRD